VGSPSQLLDESSLELTWTHISISNSVWEIGLTFEIDMFTKGKEKAAALAGLGLLLSSTFYIIAPCSVCLGTATRVVMLHM